MTRPDADRLRRDLSRRARYQRQPSRRAPAVTPALVDLARRFGAGAVLARLERIAGRRYDFLEAGVDEGPGPRFDRTRFTDRAHLRPEHLPFAVMPFLRLIARRTATRLPYVVAGFNRAVEHGDFERLEDLRGETGAR